MRMGRANDEPLTPVAFLDRSAQVFADRTAVVDGEVRLTYAEFAAHVDAVASGLAALGVGPGDRVAYLAFNGLPLLAAHYAVPALGGALVAINIRLARAEIPYILRHSGARALVFDPALLTEPAVLRAECPELSSLVALGDGVEGADLTYDALLARGRADGRPGAAPRRIDDERALLAINYTSGTTGAPKGVMYSHRGAYLNALGNAVEVGLSPETRYLWTLPMFHCNGWCYTWSVTAVGGVHICLPKVVAAEVFRLIAAERVTHLCAAPTVLIDLAQYAAENAVRLATPLSVMTGGAAPAPQVIRNMEAIGARVTHLYGLTETYGPAVFCQWRSEWDALPFEEQAARKARQGVPDLIVRGRVVRPDMTDVVPDGQELGELVLRGNGVMLGYYRDEAATETAFAGGWFHTGDLAVMHPDGYVEVKDRAKDVIISGGENISTLEVESVIYRHPAVLEVAVVASPHPRWGEVPKAFVVLKPGAQLTAEALHAHCRQYLAGFKSPRLVEFVDALPKTSTGKIQKHLLRARAAAGDRAP